MVKYAIVPNIDAPELTATDIAVWTALCRFAQWELDDGKPIKSKAGTCFPSLTNLQQTAHCARATVCASLKKLERLGFITRNMGNNIHGNIEYTLFPEGQTGSSIVELVQMPDGGSSVVKLGVVQQLNSGSSAVELKQTHITNPYNKPIEQEAEVKAAAAETPDRVSLSQVAKLWNDKLGPLGFPSVMKDTPARKRAFQARVNESPERHTLEWWRGLMARIAGAAFLVDSAKQQAKWLSFDWVLNENNLVKILEGRYDRRQEERGQPSPKRQQEPPPQTWAEAVARYRHKHGYDKEDGDNAGTGLICIS